MNRYRVIELPLNTGLYASTTCINNAHRVGGAVHIPRTPENTISVAAYWENNQQHQCTIPHSEIYAMNNRGIMLCGPSLVSWSGNEERPKTPNCFLWDGEHITSLSDDGFAGINDAGVLVGVTNVNMPKHPILDVVVNGRACYWKEGKRYLLPIPNNLWGSAATRINIRGTIAGSITKNNWQTTGPFTIPVIWQNARMFELPGQRTDYRWQDINSINDDDIVVGEVEDPIQGMKPYLWYDNKLEFLPLPPGTTGYAAKINKNGLVLGEFQPSHKHSEFCLWKNRKLYQLKLLLVNGAVWKITLVTGINDTGQISAVGKRPDGNRFPKSRPLLLDPV